MKRGYIYVSVWKVFAGKEKKEKTGETDTKRRDAAEGDGWWQVVRPGVVIKGEGGRGVSGRLAKRFLFLFSF